MPSHSRPTRGGEFKERRKGGGLAEFTCCKTVTTHNNFIARRQAGAVQESGSFKRPGVGPNGMMVEADERQGPVGNNGVQNVTGDGKIIAK